MRPSIRSAIFSTIFLVLGCLPLLAQDSPTVSMGVNPQATYQTGDFDSVDLATGRLHLDIPLVVDKSQRGKGLNDTYKLVYTSSSSWGEVCANNVCYYTTGRFGLVGVSLINPSTLVNHQYHYKDKTSSPPNDYYEYTYNEGAWGIGASHDEVGGIPLDGSQYYVSGGVSGNSLEGCLTPDLSGATDTNGNQMTTTWSNNGTESFCTTSDTLGRTWTLEMSIPGNLASCPVGAVNTSTWTVPGPNGTSRIFTFCYSNVATSVDIPPGSGYRNDGTIQEMTGVILPDGTKWEFDYDSWGDIDEVKTPTGGTISYGWTTTPDACGEGIVNYLRTVVSRTVNDGTASHTWLYSISSSVGLPLTMTDPLNNDTVATSYNKGGCTGLISQIQYYSGTGSGRTLLKTVTNTYQDLPDPYPSDMSFNGFVPADPQLLLGTTTQWANGETSKVTKAYDCGYFSFTDHNPVGIGQGPGVTYTSTCPAPATNPTYGLVTTETQSDFGANTPGPVLSATNTSYLALSNSNYISSNLIDLVSSVVTTDGGGNKCAETDYGYDEAGRLVTYTGTLTQHTTAPFSVLGNLTSITRQYSSTPCTSSATWTPLPSTIYTVYNTGMRATSTDPNSNLTSYSYTYLPSGDSSCAATADYYGAFVTQTTLPNTSSPNSAPHTISGCYDANTGLLTRFFDQNNNENKYTYDVMLRPTNVTYPSPDGGQTNFYYPNTTTVEMKKSIDGSRWTDSYVYFDGLGREIRQASINDEPIPYDQVDTCYDADGRVLIKTYPYPGNGGVPISPFCSNAGDTFAYDPLNRTTSVTHSDGTSVLTSYTGRATSVQDEGYDNASHRVQRISQVDGLGRLTSLCEVTSTTLTVGISGSTTPVSCGQDISGTGFLTSYTYDALSNLTSVAQGPLNPRSFTYDSLSRVLCANNPEVQNAACPTPDTGTYTPGTIRYGYDANSNLTSKIAPMPNQTTVSAAKTVTTTMAYDALNRLLSKTYTNNDSTTNTTPSVTFNYDQTSALGVTGLLNTDGRSSSSLVAGSQAGEVFSYDELGRVKINSQCTPQNCGGPSVFPINYTYDLLGDTLTATNGEGVTLTYGAYNRALRITAMTSSLSDANHPGTLYSSAHYNAAGSVVSASIGNPGSSVSETRVYDGRLRICGITDGSIYNVAIPSSTANQCQLSSTNGYAPDSDILLANDSVNGNWTYGYDAFNRLTSASATGQAYTYAYDRFGNRWQQNGPHSSQPGFDGNNHMVPGLGVTYDAAGNETNDGVTSYTFDSENRIITATSTASGTSSYFYDADGRRIRKTTTAGGTVDFLYDLGGLEISQITSTGSWTRGEIYVGGRHLGIYTGGTGGNTYLTFADWLGTERARSLAGASTACETMTSLPFGDWLTTSGSCGDPSPMHFTGKEHDNESGLENFGARYDSSQYGRFMTPDSAADEILSVPIPFADLSNPQSLNLYSYVRNNPLSFTDPDGQNVNVCLNDENGNQQCHNYTDDQYKKLYNAQNGQQGINLPGGQFPRGSITCGGQTCGSATYNEAPLEDQTAGMVMGYEGGKLAGILLGKVVGAIGGMLGRGAGEVAGETAGQGGARVLLSGGSKQAAKDIVEGLADGAQKASAKRAIAAATRSEAVSISESADGTLTVTRTRAGFDGSQTFTKTIDSAGNSSTVQTAHDAAGNLVHYDPKN